MNYTVYHFIIMDPNPSAILLCNCQIWFCCGCIIFSFALILIVKCYWAVLKRRFDVIEIHLLDKYKAAEKDWWILVYPAVYMVSLFIGINALSSIGCMLISYRIRWNGFMEDWKQFVKMKGNQSMLKLSM